MTIWFSADFHLGHSRIIEFCKRPFKDVDEMNEEIIRRWNSCVNDSDTGYILGDFCFGDPRKYYSRLNGRVYIVPGSHDKELRKLDQKFILPSIYVLKGLLDDKRLGITLCHYSMRTFSQSHYGAIHLYGHSHHQLTDDPMSLSFDVGVDGWNFYPLSIEQVKEKMDKKKKVMQQN